MSFRTEIIPLEPDAVHTDEGKKYVSARSRISRKLYCMQCTLNGNPVEIHNHAPLQAVLDAQQIAAQCVAVAINDTVIPRNQWSKTTLNPNDKILVITATQGG